LILENLATLKSALKDFRGGLAQLGEHLLCKQGVNGSIPLSSTIILHKNNGNNKAAFD
jgi:hypothetical protein